MTLKDLGMVTEQQRMRMGIPKPVFAREIGIAPMTYVNFLKGARKINAKSLYAIIMFLERMGRIIPDITDLRI